MRIVITHLTRMQPGFICVAGIDTATGDHVRPVLGRERLGRHLLVGLGGPFDVATLADLGPTRRVGHPPETEDHFFDPAHARRVRDLARGEFWELLRATSKRNLAEIFGEGLQAQGNGCAVDVDAGRASLGSLIPSTAPRLWVNDFGKIRIDVTDGTGASANLSVTDLRMYEADQETPRRQIVAQVHDRMEFGAGVILSVGLARAWQKPGDTVPRHWLQVNGVHLADDPTWRVGRIGR